MMKWDETAAEWVKDDSFEKSVPIPPASIVHFYEDWVV